MRKKKLVGHDSSSVMIHVYREIVTHTIYIRNPAEREKAWDRHYASAENAISC